MQKFSHRPVTLVNIERQEKPSFFSYSRIYVPNETELEALRDFMSLLLWAIVSIFPHWKSTAVSLYWSSFSRFCCLNAYPRSRLPSAKRGENKSKRTLSFIPLRHDLTARDSVTARTYLSFFPYFSRLLCYNHRERSEGFISARFTKVGTRGWWGWRRLLLRTSLRS